MSRRNRRARGFRLGVFATLPALIVLLLPGRAAATHEAGWQTEAAGVPSTTTLSDVALAGGHVIAVGTDTPGGGSGTLAIHRRSSAGSWQVDTVSGLPAGVTASSLVAVATTPSAAWAVGSYDDDADETHPLVLRAEGGAAALDGAAPVNWSPPATLPALMSGLPTAVALRSDTVLIGTDAGEVHPGSVAGDSVGAAIAPAATAGAVNDVALYSPPPAGSTAAGFVVTDFKLGQPDRIYEVLIKENPAPSTMTSVTDLTDATDNDVVGVGAVSQGIALAIDGSGGPSGAPAPWRPQSGVWKRTADPAFDNTSAPSSAALINTGGSVTVGAIAGAHAGAGAVWRNTSGGAFTRDSGAAAQPLNGVAPAAARDIWAVGEAGTVVHYTPLADPPPPPPPPPPPLPETVILSGPQASSAETKPSFSFDSDQADAIFECRIDGAAFAPCTSPYTSPPLGLGDHTFAVRATTVDGTDPTPATRSFEIVAPGSEVDPDACTDPGELVTSVRVKLKSRGSKGGKRGRRAGRALNSRASASGRKRAAKLKLVIRFRVEVPSRVKVLAKRGGKVVGRAPRKGKKALRLPVGPHRVAFKVKKKPKRVRLIAAPQDKCKSADDESSNRPQE